MRALPRLALALLALGAAGSAAPAQAPEMIGLDRIHQLFLSDQGRAAARELKVVSVEFRNEIGRCRDESLGAKLMELEPRFDQLSAKVAAGTVTSVATLEQEFVVIDRLLAENHLQLASTGWGLRRFGRLEGVANDLTLAAQYLSRAAKWAHAPLASEAQQAVDDALATAKAIRSDPTTAPAGTPDVLAALAKALKDGG